jgi:photosystem II stability/assembly factor-like uncharacterized protein
MAAVITVVAVALVLTRGPVARRAAANPPSASATPGISPRSAPLPLSAYRVARTVTMEPAYLDCLTQSVCYAWFSQPTQSASARPSERTLDGGATWQQLASPPGSEVLNSQVKPSCPTVQMCVAVTEHDTLAVTTDSGVSWRLEPLPSFTGWIDQVSCATVRECVIHVSGGLTEGTFLSTTNGGSSWITATHVPSGAPGGLQFLRCDPGGRCIAAASAGLGTAYSPGHGPGLKVMRSADHGLTWSLSVTDSSVTNHVPPASSSAPGFMLSCSDSMHCMYSGGSGVAITSDGGLTWREVAIPQARSAWTVTSMSCAAGLSCSVALVSKFVSQKPMIGTTSDGMTWTLQPLPSLRADPLQYVTLLSCSRPGGCLGLASTLSQEKSAFLGSGGFSTGIVETSPQMLISSLGS